MGLTSGATQPVGLGLLDLLGDVHDEGVVAAVFGRRSGLGEVQRQEVLEQEHAEPPFQGHHQPHRFPQ